MVSNRTSKYLWKAIAFGYPKEFRAIFDLWDSSHLVRGMYIGDIIGGKEEYTPNCLYLALIRPVGIGGYKQKFEAKNLLERIYDIDDKTCMLVLRIPEAYDRAYPNFMKYRYSKMYPKSFLEAMRFPDGKYPPAYHVLARTEEQRQSLIAEWGLSDNWDGPEYDGEWLKSAELFQYKPEVAAV